MIDSRRAIRLLRQQIDSTVDDLSVDDPNVYEWWNLTQTILEEAFGKHHRNVNHFACQVTVAGEPEDERQERHIRTVHEKKGMLKAYIKELEVFSPSGELADSSPIEIPLAGQGKLDTASISAAWHKALERRNEDPEGAITAARTLLESVCKHVLDELGVEYGDSADLPKLYGLTSKELNLAPSQQTEDAFKKILGGVHSVVDGLANLRNRLGDAHGQGKNPVKPLPRHAELAVNMAGSMASFLLATFESKTGRQ